MRSVFIILVLLMSFESFAKDVQVRGYYRKNGTYVKPHVRSAPDGVKWNNYGSGSDPVRQRDSDHDGTPNYLDTDDDNDGIHDDNE